ncbi:Uncharacterized protein APZ42_000604 [Daphnia magna]|uniref:Uncharacterized protein n=1 Tax=Daphnia magna TaxID=35525 RepID=A0A164JIC1_9CRUS|nr:Uncharacterized protein APZ42_000604 [Daphnia magna]
MLQEAMVTLLLAAMFHEINPLQCRYVLYYRPRLILPKFLPLLPSLGDALQVAVVSLAQKDAMARKSLVVLRSAQLCTR